MNRSYIWRVEDADGLGPYLTIGESVWAEEEHCKETGRPTPSYDRGIDRRPDHNEICGFISIYDVKKWFTKEELLNLYAHGFCLKRVPVAEITAIGEKQVLAVRGN